MRGIGDETAFSFHFVIEHFKQIIDRSHQRSNFKRSCTFRDRAQVVGRAQGKLLAQLLQGKQTFFDAEPDCDATTDNQNQLRQKNRYDYMSNDFSACVSGFSYFQNQSFRWIVVVVIVCFLLGKVAGHGKKHGQNPHFSAVQKAGRIVRFIGIERASVKRQRAITGDALAVHGVDLVEKRIAIVVFENSLGSGRQVDKHLPAFVANARNYLIGRV